MFDILIPWVAIAAGFVGLLWSADRFVEGSAAVADNLGVSKFIIGLTIVAFGTSAPEVIVSITSAINKAGDLAIGNALGSNLANVGLVLGITALLYPLPFKTSLLSQEFPIMGAIMIIAGFFLWDATLYPWEGIVLILLIIPLIVWLAYFKKPQEDDDDDIEHFSMKMAIVWFIVGLILLIISAESLVWGAKAVALSFGVSPLVIGLTIVAVGTSLPELAATITSARKGHHDIAVGNIVGSNIFNLILVMGIAPVFGKIVMDDNVFNRDFLSMAGITVVLAVAMITSLFANKQKPQIGRFVGAVLLILYLSYYALLFL